MNEKQKPLDASDLLIETPFSGSFAPKPPQLQEGGVEDLLQMGLYFTE